MVPPIWFDHRTGRRPIRRSSSCGRDEPILWLTIEDLHRLGRKPCRTQRIHSQEYVP
jgi:hypothetical protein